MRPRNNKWRGEFAKIKKTNEEKLTLFWRFSNITAYLNHNHYQSELLREENSKKASSLNVKFRKTQIEEFIILNWFWEISI